MPDSAENSKAFLHSSSGASLGPLTFEEIFGNVSTLHADKELAGSLFQVASQFNVLEMVSPDVGPEEGVTCYQHDRTQGPACAMACPAATVFRFVQRCAFLTPHTSHLTPHTSHLVFNPITIVQELLRVSHWQLGPWPALA